MIFAIHKAVNKARVTIEPTDNRPHCLSMIRAHVRLMRLGRSPLEARGTPKARCSARIKLYISIHIQMFNCLPPELAFRHAELERN